MGPSSPPGTGPTGHCGPVCRAMLPLIYVGIFLICLGQFVGFSIWLKRNRRRAAVWADKNAARNTILPIYDWVLYWEILYIITRAMYIWYIQQQFTKYVWGTTIIFCASKVSQYFVCGYLVQHRMGNAAVIRAVAVAMWLFLITIVLHEKNRLWEYLLDLMIFSSVLSYAYNQRTGRYRYFVWYLGYLIMLSAIAACMFGGLVQASKQTRLILLIFSDFCRVAVHPGLLLMVLVADSQWWRSLSDSIIRMGVRPGCSFRKLGAPRKSRSSLELGEGLPLTSVQETLRTHLKLIDYCSLDFYSVEYLDKGSKGEVRRCKWKNKNDTKGIDVALKSFGKHDISLEGMLQIGKEAFLSARLEHPNIVKFFGLCLSPPSVHLVYEYCSERSLRHVLRNNKLKLSWPQRVTFALQAARGLSALHKQQIIHRDIKSRNLLVHFDGKRYLVKLCDFGSARLISENEDCHFVTKTTDDTERSNCVRSFFRTICCASSEKNPHMASSRDKHEAEDERYMTYMTAVVGTLAYMAPELMPTDFPFTSESVGPAAYGLSADIFSFGYVIWELLTRRLPYYALKDVRTLLQSVLHGGRPPVPLCPSAYEEIMRNCWHVDPGQRPTIDRLIQKLEVAHEEALKMDFECLEANGAMFEGVSFPKDKHIPIERIEKGIYQRGLVQSVLPRNLRHLAREA